MEILNSWLERWEPLWLFLVLYGEFILAYLLLKMTNREVESSVNLEKSIGKVFAKYVKRLEETNYEAFKKLLSKRTRKKSSRRKKRSR